MVRTDPPVPAPDTRWYLLAFVASFFGIAGDFRGWAHINEDGEADNYIHFIRTAGGSTIAPSRSSAASGS